jgi:hypothetical protein
MANNGELLSRDQILQAQDLRSEEVSVPEWGGVIRVRELAAGERERIAGLVTAHDGRSREIMVALTAIDGDGNQLFSLDDIEELAKKGEAAIQRVAEVASRLSGIGKAAEAQAEKNSDPSPSDDSISG